MANINATSSGTYVLGDNDQLSMNISGGGSVTVTANPTNSVKKIRIEYRDDGQTDTATVDLTSFSQDGLQIDLKKYDETDKIQLIGAFNGSIDPDNPERYVFQYIGADGNTYTGYLNAKDGNERNLFADPIIIVCFGDGTLIETDRGAVPVEELDVGDMVLTRGHGSKPIRWIGRRVVDSLTLMRLPKLRPVVVRRNAFGKGRPYQDLVLSPNHRILLDDWRAELHFGEPEVLVAAKFLRDDTRILTRPGCEAVTYHHLLFDRHEIVTSNGLETESLFFGKAARDTLDDDAMAELLILFPELDGDQAVFGPTAYTVLKSHEAALLARG